MSIQDTTSPLLTVLVPCYNVEKYVTQCLESILGQTYSNIEVICIDDGSTDSTPKILQDFSKRDPRIKIITKPNSGYGHSMNIGLDHASGDFIGIVESDDFIKQDMFEKLVTNAIKYQLDISRCSFYKYQTSSHSVTTIKTDYVPKDRVLRPIDEQGPFSMPPSIWASIYRKDFLSKNKIRFLETPGASYQDTAFSFKCYYSADRFLMIDEPLLYYRIDNPNSSVNNPKKVFCVCDEYEEIWKFAQTKTERFDKIKNSIPQLQLATYKWNFNRLGRSLRALFLKKFREDFTKLKQQGLLDIKCFKRHDKKILLQLHYLPSTLLFRSHL